MNCKRPWGAVSALLGWPHHWRLIHTFCCRWFFCRSQSEARLLLVSLQQSTASCKNKTRQNLFVVTQSSSTLWYRWLLICLAHCMSNHYPSCFERKRFLLTHLTPWMSNQCAHIFKINQNLIVNCFYEIKQWLSGICDHGAVLLTPWFDLLVRGTINDWTRQWFGRPKCQEHPNSGILFFHCIIHQSVLSSKLSGSLKETLNKVWKRINFLGERSALWHRELRQYLEELIMEHADLLLHNDLRSLNKGKWKPCAWENDSNMTTIMRALGSRDQKSGLPCSESSKSY